MTKKIIKEKLLNLLNIDDISVFNISDDLLIWGKKEFDEESSFIWGEIIGKDSENYFSEILLAFTFDKKTDLDDLSQYILEETKK